jgi:Fe-S-cluster containining protein
VTSRFDCQSCGVCCCNTAFNREHHTREYIEVARDDVLLQTAHKERLKQLAVRNAEGKWHLKLVNDEQRCNALEGELMKGVACTIYTLRPSGCRKVEAGDEECLIARRRFGLPLTRAGDLERIAAMDDDSNDDSNDVDDLPN